MVRDYTERSDVNDEDYRNYGMESIQYNSVL